MQEKTVFHKIIAREIPADIVYEDEEVVAFRDIHPKAPTHLLFVPNTFLQSVHHITQGTEHLPGLLVLKAQKFAAQHGFTGYKLVYHVGKDGGQEVPYIHLHFLSEQELQQ